MVVLAEVCLHCGEPETVEVLEIWLEDRAFQIETCCEESRGGWVEEMRHWTRERWKIFMAHAGLGVRSVAGHHGQFVLDYGLELVGSVTAKVKRAAQARGETVRAITRDQARQFVRDNHRHSPAPPAGWRWGHAVWNGPELVAIAMVGRPAARLTNASTTVEVTRLCVLGSAVPCVAWNACSMLYGAAAREARARGFKRVQTFTLDSEAGTSLKAVGWTQDGVTKREAKGWDRPSRRRGSKTPTQPKVRWVKDF